jgi:hypothetical protein
MRFKASKRRHVWAIVSVVSFFCVPAWVLAGEGSAAQLTENPLSLHSWLTVAEKGRVFSALAFTERTSPGAKQHTWHFDQTSDYAYLTEVVAVDRGGNSLAQLKTLPKDYAWKASYTDPRPNHGPEYHNFALDPDRNVVAVGTDADFNTWNSELILCKYNQKGQVISGWPKFYKQPGFRWHEGHDVVLDADGSITVAGYLISQENRWFLAVWRFDKRGKLLDGWPKTPVNSHSYGTGLVVDAKGDIFVCGSAGSTGYEQLVLVKLSVDGSVVSGWPKTYEVAGSLYNFAYDLIQDLAGNLVVAGYTQSTSVTQRRAALYKLDNAGKVLPGWPKLWDSGTGGNDEYFAVSQDRNGDYCLVGTTGGASKTEGKLLVTRYSASGKQLTASGWPKVFPCEGYRDASPPDAWRGAVDSSGNIAAAVICQSDTQVRTVKYTKKAAMFSGYPKTYDRRYYYDATRSSGVDDLDNVYAVGYSESLLTDDYSTFIIKYPPSTYSTGRPWVTTENGVNYNKLSGFKETLGEENQGKVSYQLSPDGKAWYYHNGRHWQPAANKHQGNSAAQLNTRLGTFGQEVGAGTLHLRAFLVSNGKQKVQLDAVSVSYDE